MNPSKVAKGGLEMEFSVAPDGRTILTHLLRRAPMIVQQALYFDERLPTMACIYTLSSGGPYLEGDSYEVEVGLQRGAMVRIAPAAATVIAPVEHTPIELRQRLRLTAESYLEWLPRALIPTRNSLFESRTEIVIHPSASLIYAELCSCGRLHSGERFDYGALSLSTIAMRPDGATLLREQLSLRPKLRSPEEWGLLGGFTHFASVLILSPVEHTEALYEELGPYDGENLRMSIARLRDSCGLSIRLLGHSEEQLLREIHSIASRFRLKVKGAALPAEFAWR